MTAGKPPTATLRRSHESHTMELRWELADADPVNRTYAPHTPFVPGELCVNWSLTAPATSASFHIELFPADKKDQSAFARWTGTRESFDDADLPDWVRRLARYTYTLFNSGSRPAQKEN